MGSSLSSPSVSGPLNNFVATGYPTATNDASQGYTVGSRWLVQATGEMFFCRDATAGVAAWTRADTADFFGYVAGNWYAPYGPSAVATGVALGSGVIRFMPWINKQRFTMSALGLRIITASSGGSIRQGIYAADPVSKRPTGLALVDTGAMTTTTATTISAAVSYQFETGEYWFAALADNANVVCYSDAGINNLQMIGSTTEANVTGVSKLNIGFTQAFGPLPDLTGASLVEGLSSGSIPPIPHFKAGSVP